MSTTFFKPCFANTLKLRISIQTYSVNSVLSQCCTQFKSPGVKILCVLYLHYNVAFTFK